MSQQPVSTPSNTPPTAPETAILQELEQLRDANHRMTQLLTEIERTSQAIFASYSWRIGRMLTRPGCWIGLCTCHTAEEHTHYLFQTYHAWNRSAAPIIKPRLTLRELLHAGKQLTTFNTWQLLWQALRELPQTGVNGFIRRSREYLKLQLERVEQQQADAMLIPVLSKFSPVQSVLLPPYHTQTVDIILPIYNGLNYLTVLLPQLMRNSDAPFRLILVDDASSDPQVTDYLMQFVAQYPDTTLLLRAPVNQGFVRSVNWAYTQVKYHFVILNQDTEIPPYWLSRLLRPLLIDATVASATPYSNAATICSFPLFPYDAPRFASLDTETLDRCLQQVAINSVGYPLLPTGVGFCMAINKNVADILGLFDAETFGRGYGEENDWCLRAQARGYKNVLVPNLFVFHAHGGSFLAEEKQQLLAANLKKLNARYPEYAASVARYLLQDPQRDLRQFLIILASTCVANKKILAFDHALGGGSNSYFNQRLAEWHEQDHCIFIVHYYFATGVYRLSFMFREWRVNYQLRAPEELVQLCAFVHFDELHINSLVSYPQISTLLALLATLKQQFSFQIFFYLHDYHAICPVYTLLNYHERYCGIPLDADECRICLNENHGDFRLYGVDEQHKDIRPWRQNWRSFLSVADTIICFSQASADILRQAYTDPATPLIIKIQPHSIQPLRQVQRRSLPVPGVMIKIGVLGAINVQKGLHLIQEMADCIERECLPVRIILIGISAVPINNACVEVTGRYDRDHLPAQVERIGIDWFFIPSIWPETYLFTADEVMAMGLPLVVFNLGAPPERVARYPSGWIIELCDGRTALYAMLQWAQQGYPQIAVMSTHHCL